MADADKKEQVKTEEAQPKKSGLVKWVIIGLAALLVLGGGGFVSYKTFLKPAEKRGRRKKVPPWGLTWAHLSPGHIHCESVGRCKRSLKVTMELELKENKLVVEVEKRRNRPVRDTNLRSPFLHLDYQFVSFNSSSIVTFRYRSPAPPDRFTMNVSRERWARGQAPRGQLLP